MGIGHGVVAGLVAWHLGAWAGPPAREEAGGHRAFQLLGPEEGMPPTSVLSMTQDRDGFIWFGTENGLVRFEGRHSRRWGTEDGLPSSYVAQVLADPQGGVWAATLRGLVRLREGRVEVARLGSESAATPVSTVVADTRGRIWTATPKAIYRLAADLTFAPLPWQSGESLTIVEVGRRSGIVYTGGEGGIHAFHPDGRIQVWGPADGLPTNGVTQVVEDGEGRVWAGHGRTLVVKAPGEVRFRDQSMRLGGSLSPNGTSFADRDGSVWLPTQHGALRLQGEGVERVDATNGLPFRWVRSVFRDREGTLWVIGPGLARLRGGGLVRNYTLSGGLTGEIVWWVHRDPGGDLLVGTDDGAARLGPDGLVRIPGTEGRRLKSLARGADGTLWMVGTIGPILWLRPGQIRAEQPDLGPLGSSLNTVMTDRQGRTWFGHARAGVLRWDPEGRRLVQEAGPELAGVPRLGAFKMEEDAQGQLWVGCSMGLLLRRTDGSWRLFTEKEGLQPGGIRGMALLPDGSLWVHYTEARGLTRLRLSGDRLVVEQRLEAGKGLRTDLIYALARDAKGQVWATSDRGLMRLEPRLDVGREQGMVSEDCSVQALLTEGDHVWVGTSSGLARYTVRDRDEGAPPQAHILSAEFGAQRFEPPFGALPVVPHSDATTTFRLAAPSYLNPGAMRFQVRLEGLESGWREVEENRVRYPALAGGRYRLWVRALPPGSGPGPEASLAFRVRPPWWATWWFRTALGLGAVGAVAAVIRFRLAAMARSKAELEAVVRQRTEELKARNQDLTEALAQVKHLSGLLPICASCKKIRDDGGQWNSLETYISSHSEAAFTHGICPECAQTFLDEGRSQE